MDKQCDYGIVFDNHFTDSFISAISKEHSTKYRSLTPICDPLQPHEALTSLLLHGKAYLSRPVWIDKLPTSDLNPLIDEGLIDWIPRVHYNNAFDKLATLYDLSKDIAPEFFEDEVPPNLATDGTFYGRSKVNYRSPVPVEQISNSEALFTRNLFLRKSLFLRPSIVANLNHLNISISASQQKYLDPIGAAGRASDIFDQYRCYADIPSGSTFQILFELLDQYNISQIPYYTQTVYGAKVLDAYVSSLAMDKFIATEKLPSNVSSSNGMSYENSKALRHKDEIALVKIQFDKVRYPVIENITDVIRLRSSPHLESYREVIREYSTRLQESDEYDRQTILLKFKHDIDIASKTISSIHHLNTMNEKFSFYFSIPSAAMGYFFKLSMPEIIPVGVAGLIKVATHVIQRKHRWIIFGRN